MREAKRFYARVSRKHSKTMKFHELEKREKGGGEELVRTMDWICMIVQAVEFHRTSHGLTACWLETLGGFIVNRR